MPDRRLLSATTVMASGTLTSRLLGAARVIVTGKVLWSSSRQGDIFAFALMIPNSVYTIVATGLINAILVPQIVRAERNDPDGGEAYTNRIITAFLLIFLAVTLLCLAGTPSITRLVVSSQWRVPELAAQYRSVVILTAFCMPQIFLYGAFVLVGQVLNARRVFGPMMWAPVANNVIQIATIGLYAGLYGAGGKEKNAGPFTTTQMAVLAVGWGIALVVQFAVLLPFAHKVHFRYRPRFDFLHTGLARTFSVAKWSLLFVAVANAALYAMTRLLTRGTAGGQGAGKNVYDIAYLMFAMPHSVIAVSLATALVPTLSSLAAQDRLRPFAGELASSVRLVITVLLPVALLLIALGRPVFGLVFPGDSGGNLIGWTLMALAAGLVPFSVQYVLQRAYFAREDTRSVFVFELVMAVTWVAVAWLTVSLLHVPARWTAPVVAAANAVSMVVGLTVTLAHLRRRLPEFGAGRVLRQVVRVGLAALPGTAVAWFIVTFQASRWNATLANSIGLVAAGLAGVGVYLGMARLLHVEEVDQVMGLVTRRSRQASQAEEVSMAVVNPPRADGSPPEPYRPPAAEGPATPAPASPESPVSASWTPLTFPSPPGAPLTANPTAAPTPAKVAASLGDTGGQPVLTGFAPLVEGQLLADRYRLEQRCGREAHASRWRATDESLGRPVLILALEDEDTADSVIEAARRSTAATDARFVRILDAIADADGFYVISEWVEGMPLCEILRTGPLSPVESAWVAKEVAEPLTTIHPLRVFHQRLDPSRILITTAGDIRIAGLTTAAVLNPRPGDAALTREELELQDVRDLGRLLYACETGAWPGPEDVGLPEAPHLDGAYSAPKRLQPATNATLDRVTDQLLAPNPRGGLPRLTTAAAALRALGQVLGTADSTEDLAHRLVLASTSPTLSPAQVTGAAVPPVILPAGTPTLAPPEDAPAPPPEGAPPVARRALPEPGSSSAASLPAQPGPAGPAPGPAATPPPGRPTPADGSAATPSSPASAATSPSPVDALAARRPWSIGLVVLAAVVVLALLTALIVGLAHNSSPSDPSGAAATATTAPIGTPVAVANAWSFDPFGSGMENDDQLSLAHDGSESTAWLTESYPGPTPTDATGRPKQGVGLVVGLEQATPLRGLGLTLANDPTPFTVYVPDDSTAAAPPLAGLDGWRAVAEGPTPADSREQVVTLEATARFVLVFFHDRLPAAGDGYQTGIAEITPLM